jgi:hypothetical protein
MPKPRELQPSHVGALVCPFQVIYAIGAQHSFTTLSIHFTLKTLVCLLLADNISSVRLSAFSETDTDKAGANAMNRRPTRFPHVHRELSGRMIDFLGHLNEADLL